MFNINTDLIYRTMIGGAGDDVGDDVGDDAGDIGDKDDGTFENFIRRLATD